LAVFLWIFFNSHEFTNYFSRRFKKDLSRYTQIFYILNQIKSG
jgi:hypothetical protein